MSEFMIGGIDNKLYNTAKFVKKNKATGQSSLPSLGTFPDHPEMIWATYRYLR
ncbi:MAG: hypothetical protein P4L49_18895 [Desulfosporosinus sp.]|nr:hypothetical protein [Desulfosporosinus sp.]